MGYNGVSAVFVCPVFLGAYFLFLSKNVMIYFMNIYSMPKLSMENFNAINPTKNFDKIN